jgi:hypothetical protein
MIKAAIIVAVALLLFVIARRLSAGEPSFVPEPPQPPQPDVPEDDHQSDAVHTARAPFPALAGADLPFPIPLPPVTRLADGRYNRPNILNYYFKKLDLVHGPADPKVFFDDFFLHYQDPSNDHALEMHYVVATPAGLQQELDADVSSSLYFEVPVIIVPKWDLTAILKTVVEEVIKGWGTPDDDAESAPVLPIDSQRP